ncbi:DeoR/GlpR family DNA-binding transcription regulator [Pseudarthrobacter sp. J1763]|uniref:DeoR/GlpR family DNA-binding transcription regulator n=1 Tax=Pseudarthrobacter sp. J1763 TaxID=3420445 RepID=UPI003D2B7B0B
MFAEERHQLITSLVSSHGRVSVTDLAERFDITTETVRRDLATLEADGVLRRVHGGAVSADRSSTIEANISERLERGQEAKQRLARAALKLIPAGAGSIILDAGSTTGALAELLADRPNAASLAVITSAVPIAATLAGNNNIALELLGGRVRGLTRAAVGHSTVEALRSLRPDIAFIGTNGIAADFGLSTPDPEEAAVKAAIVRAAQRVVVLADASKLGTEALVQFASLDQIDALITDGTLSPELASALAEAQVEVVLV